MTLNDALLVVAGYAAGLIDSMAGGGGLITLPVLSLRLGPGAHAIGSNKIVGVSAALVALIVYARAGHFRWKNGLLFCVCVMFGSAIGSHLSPYCPVEVFRWLLIALAPVILWIVWRKDRWVEVELRVHRHDLSQSRGHHLALAVSGLACGFYDGAFGPGGGTFMFLALLFVVRMPLMTALATSKLANTISAGTALVSYAAGGYVHWLEGTLVAVGISVGAWQGSRWASRKSTAIVRPMLLVAVVLLLAKLLFEAL